MERGLPCAGRHQGLHNAMELVRRAWPAMKEKERARALILGSLVNEVESDAVNASLELIEAIQQCFGATPVEVLAPVLAELRQVDQICAVRPIRVANLARDPTALEACPEIIEDVFRDPNSKALDLVVGVHVFSTHRRHYQK